MDPSAVQRSVSEVTRSGVFWSISPRDFFPIKTGVRSIYFPKLGALELACQTNQRECHDETIHIFNRCSLLPSFCVQEGGVRHPVENLRGLLHVRTILKHNM